MDVLVKDLAAHPVQAVAGQTAQAQDYIAAILAQTGRADVSLATFSTGERFIRAMLRLKDAGLAGRLTLLADTRAVRKTLNILPLAKQAFDEVRFARTHAKFALIDAGHTRVAYVTSQNQTAGYRWEAGIITTDSAVYDTLAAALDEIITNGSTTTHDTL